MPLTLTLTEGVLPKGAEREAISRITDALLKHHRLASNTVMRPQVTATVHVLPRGTTFSGGEEVSGAWVEWRLPSFAMTDRKVQVAFCSEATEVIHELSGKRQPRKNIYVNVVHTVDGAWNFDGKALTNAEIHAAVSKG
jgi:phenylpyruvate tautomerase PptA (4-oxalocrotonate tautomerase family)